MPIVLLLLVALAAGSLATVLAAHYPHTGVARPRDRAVRQLGHTIAEHRRLRRLVRSRLDPAAATGLALSLALFVIFLAGIVVAVLTYLVRSSSRLLDLDRSVGQWGVDHRTEWSTNALELVTSLGDTGVAIALALVVGIIESVRRPSRWIFPFLVVVLAGEVFLTKGLKRLIDRARPEFDAITETLGPSFPSGHSATAAALFGALGLLVSRGRTPRQRSLIVGVAAGLAAGVACSRVMLGVHWLSDVVAGVLFGWAWFAACSIAFGGRILRFGAPAREAIRVAEEDLREAPRPGA